MGLFSKWFKENEQGVAVLDQRVIEQFNKICVDIPADQDFLFEVNGTTFVGRYVGNHFGKKQFIVEEGLLNLNGEATVKVIRKADVGESIRLSDTKYKVENEFAIRFLQLQDLIA